ncbi:WD repeat-containing protein pop2 [Smittium mucronatum]|uniref:WD repeat-containing protein pop2 n=1 Tax=Smittium mucronatum TaxID=133383 RepID=A0A1R0H702_9FUNG|nr:WD repeat-containing protein pop2 [Smittium mucronatum]
MCSDDDPAEPKILFENMDLTIQQIKTTTTTVKTSLNFPPLNLPIFESKDFPLAKSNIRNTFLSPHSLDLNQWLNAEDPQSSTSQNSLQDDDVNSDLLKKLSVLSISKKPKDQESSLSSLPQSSPCLPINSLLNSSSPIPKNQSKISDFFLPLNSPSQYEDFRTSSISLNPYSGKSYNTEDLTPEINSNIHSMQTKSVTVPIRTPPKTINSFPKSSDSYSQSYYKLIKSDPNFFVSRSKIKPMSPLFPIHPTTDSEKNTPNLPKNSSIDSLSPFDVPSEISISTNSIKKINLDKSDPIINIYSIPSIIQTYNSLPENFQMLLMNQLLENSKLSILQFTRNKIEPALKKDILGNLPIELVNKVFKFMDLSSLVTASRASFEYQHLIDGPSGLDAWNDLLISYRYKRLIKCPNLLSTIHFFSPGLSPNIYSTDQDSLAFDLKSSLLLLEHDNIHKKQFSQAYSLEQRWKYGTSYNNHPFTDPTHNHLGSPTFQNSSHAINPSTTSLLGNFGTNVVTCLSISKNLLIGGFENSTIVVFDLLTDKLLFELVGHEGGVWALCVIDNIPNYFNNHNPAINHGTFLVSGSTDRTVRIWDLSDGNCVAVYHGHSSTIRCIGFSWPIPNVTPNYICGKKKLTLDYMSTVDPYIVSGSRDCSLIVWKLPSCILKLSRHAKNPIRESRKDSLPSSCKGKKAEHRNSDPIPDYGADGSRVLNSPFLVESTNFLGHNKIFTHRNYNEENEDSDYQSSDSDQEPNNSKIIHTFTGHTQSVRTVATIGNLIVSGSYDKTVHVWDVITKRCIHELVGHTEKVYSVVIDESHGYIVSSSLNGDIRVWDILSGATISVLVGHRSLVGLLSINKYEVSSDFYSEYPKTGIRSKSTLISAGADSQIRIWNLETCQLEACLSGHSGPVTCIAHNEFFLEPESWFGWMLAGNNKGRCSRGRREDSRWNDQ